MTTEWSQNRCTTDCEHPLVRSCLSSIIRLRIPAAINSTSYCIQEPSLVWWSFLLPHYYKYSYWLLVVFSLLLMGMCHQSLIVTFAIDFKNLGSLVIYLGQLFHYDKADQPYVVCGDGNMDPWDSTQPPLPEYFVKHTCSLQKFDLEDACNCGWAFPEVPANTAEAWAMDNSSTGTMPTISSASPKNKIIYFEAQEEVDRSAVILIVCICVFLLLVACVGTYFLARWYNKPDQDVIDAVSIREERRNTSNRQRARAPAASNRQDHQKGEALSSSSLRSMVLSQLFPEHQVRFAFGLSYWYFYCSVLTTISNGPSLSSEF